VLDSSGNVVSAISAGTTTNAVNYTWHVTKITPDLESKLFDYSFGLANTKGYNGPRSMCKIGNFIFTGGAVTISTVNSQPYAVVMTLNESDLTIASAKNYNNLGKQIHNQCDEDNGVVYFSVNNYWNGYDMPIGTGHWNQIIRVPVD